MALDLLVRNRETLARAPVLSVLSIRLMNLATLAEVADQIGRREVARDALEEWRDVWRQACDRAPKLAALDEYRTWERWVLDKLKNSQDPQDPNRESRDPPGAGVPNPE
jgi:hypothetical protein